MRELRQEYPRHTIMVLWDGRAEWRFNLCPSYKSNRDADPKKVAEREEYAKQKPYILRALKVLGVRQVTAMQHEADDLAGYFVERLAKLPGADITLITGDQDWIQLVRPGVKWRDLRDDVKQVDHTNLAERTGYFSPMAFLEGKCLQGDSSDVISGVGGIGEVGAPPLLAQFGSVREFWRQCESGEYVPTLKAEIRLNGSCPLTQLEWKDSYSGDPEDKKLRKKHDDAWPGQGRILFKRNFYLMQLLKVAEPLKSDLRIENGNLDRQGFVELCEELNFQSILKGVDAFLSPFAKH